MKIFESSRCKIEQHSQLLWYSQLIGEFNQLLYPSVFSQLIGTFSEFEQAPQIGWVQRGSFLQDLQVESPSEAPDTPSFSESPRRLEGGSSSAKERANRFRMAPVSGLLFVSVMGLVSCFRGSCGRHPAPCTVSKRSWRFLFEEGGLFLGEYLNPGLIQVPAGWVKDEYFIRLIDRVGAEAFSMDAVWLVRWSAVWEGEIWQGEFRAPGGEPDGCTDRQWPHWKPGTRQQRWSLDLDSCGMFFVLFFGPCWGEHPFHTTHLFLFFLWGLGLVTLRSPEDKFQSINPRVHRCLEAI